MSCFTVATHGYSTSLLSYLKNKFGSLACHFVVSLRPTPPLRPALAHTDRWGQLIRKIPTHEPLRPGTLASCPSAQPRVASSQRRLLLVPAPPNPPSAADSSCSSRRPCQRRPALSDSQRAAEGSFLAPRSAKGPSSRPSPRSSGQLRPAPAMDDGSGRRIIITETQTLNCYFSPQHTRYKHKEKEHVGPDPASSSRSGHVPSDGALAVVNHTVSFS